MSRQIGGTLEFFCLSAINNSRRVDMRNDRYICSIPHAPELTMKSPNRNSRGRQIRRRCRAMGRASSRQSLSELRNVRGKPAESRRTRKRLLKVPGTGDDGDLGSGRATDHLSSVVQPHLLTDHVAKQTRPTLDNHGHKVADVASCDRQDIALCYSCDEGITDEGGREVCPCGGPALGDGRHSPPPTCPKVGCGRRMSK